jgi:hypothetical protein
MYSSALEISISTTEIPSEIMIEHFALFCGNSVIIDSFQIIFFL